MVEKPEGMHTAGGSVPPCAGDCQHIRNSSKQEPGEPERSFEIDRAAEMNLHPEFVEERGSYRKRFAGILFRKLIGNLDMIGPMSSHEGRIARDDVEGEMTSGCIRMN